MSSYRLYRWIALAIVLVLVAALVPAFPSAEAAGGGAIAYGDTVSGQISAKNYYELWQFDGRKGDRVQILMDGQGGLDAYLGLIDQASEQVLAEDDDSGGDSDAYIEMTLPATGTFIIVATRYDLDTGTSQGQYQLALAASNTPTNVSNPVASTQPVEVSPGVFYMGEMAMAQPVPGTIDANSYAQIYALQVEAGTNLIVGMFADSSNLDPYLMFATEDGTILAEDDDSGAQVGGAKTDAFLQVTVKEAGTYLIGATRSGIENGKSTGAYVLVAGVPDDQGPIVQEEPVNNPAQNELPPGMEAMGMITVGDSSSATITNDSYFHIYGFDGQAGQQVTITMTGSGGLDAYLGLLDPNDEVIAEDDDSAGGTDAQISISLPESGTYIIVATRNGIDAGSTTGGYTLEVTSGTPPAPTGQTGVGGFGGLPGRALAVEGGALYLRGFGATNDLAKAPPVEAFIQTESLPGRGGIDVVRPHISLNFEEIKVTGN